MLDPQTRRSLLVEIIAAVIVVILIEPLLRLVGRGIDWSGANVYDGVSSQFYRSAALGRRA